MAQRDTVVARFVHNLVPFNDIVVVSFNNKYCTTPQREGREHYHPKGGGGVSYHFQGRWERQQHPQWERDRAAPALRRGRESCTTQMEKRTASPTKGRGKSSTTQRESWGKAATSKRRGAPPKPPKRDEMGRDLLGVVVVVACPLPQVLEMVAAFGDGGGCPCSLLCSWLLPRLAKRTIWWFMAATRGVRGKKAKNGAGEGKISRNFGLPHPLGLHPSGPHPSGPHTFVQDVYTRLLSANLDFDSELLHVFCWEPDECRDSRVFHVDRVFLRLC